MRAVRVADATDGRMPDAQRCFFIVLFTDEKYDKVTFLFSYFSMTKRRVQGGVATSERRRRDGVYQKSAKRAFPSLCELTPRARVSRTSRAWQVRAAQERNESRWLCYHPQPQPYHACEHITRKSRADSCTHCLHAR